MAGLWTCTNPMACPWCQIPGRPVRALSDRQVCVTSDKRRLVGAGQLRAATQRCSGPVRRRAAGDACRVAPGAAPSHALTPHRSIATTQVREDELLPDVVRHADLAFGGGFLDRLWLAPLPGTDSVIGGGGGR